MIGLAGGFIGGGMIIPLGPLFATGRVGRRFVVVFGS